jgi:hypothetical protein
MADREQDLESAVKHYRCLAIVNYVVVFVTLLASVSASSVAAIIAAEDQHNISPTCLAILAGLPAAILLINNAFKFETKSLWHFEKRRRLAALLRTSKFGAIDSKEIAAQWNVIDKDMDAMWPHFGPFSVPSSKPE